MNRRTFVRDCTPGACACTAASALAPLARIADDTAPAPQEDRRIRFVPKRYAKVLSQPLDETELAATLEPLGRRCAEGLPQLNAHKGEVDGFIADFGAEYGVAITLRSRSHRLGDARRIVRARRQAVPREIRIRLSYTG